MSRRRSSLCSASSRCARSKPFVSSARRDNSMLYPIMTASRELVDLNGIWEFKLDQGTGFDEEWFRRPLQGTVAIPVPASYNDLFVEEEYRDHIGWAWYERDF